MAPDGDTGVFLPAQFFREESLPKCRKAAMMLSSHVDNKREQLMPQHEEHFQYGRNKSPQDDDPTWSYSKLSDKITHQWISEASKKSMIYVSSQPFGIQHLSAPSPPVAHP